MMLLKELCNRGAFIVGTSAGASVMSDTMIVQGEDEESPRKCTLKMSPGLGLVKNIIIDQHFAQRGRIGRLLTGIAQNPEVLGIGIDENTAIIVSDKWNCRSYRSRSSIFYRWKFNYIIVMFQSNIVMKF